MISYEYVTSASRLPAIAQEIAEAECVGLDLETTGLMPHNSEIRLCQLNTGKGIYVIDAFQTKTLEPIVEAMKGPAIKVGHNLKFEQKFFLHKHKLELWPIFDTYRASAIIYNGQFVGKGTQDLYAVYARELNLAPEAPDSGLSDWSQPLLTKSQLDYAAEDVTHLFALRESLKPKLKALGLNRIALIEFGSILPEAEMELNGFYLDPSMWLKLAEENKAKAEMFRRELMQVLPHPGRQISLPGFDPDFNLDSSSQLLESLRQFGIKDLENTSEIVLAQYAKEFPVIDKILSYREFAQAVKTFGPDYLENIFKATGRIHTNFFPFTGAGRFSSSKPNLQQIPRDKRFRSCFRAPPGKRLVLADYSQIEIRGAAQIAQDRTLIEGYLRGEDAHTQTAGLVSGLPSDQVTKGHRQQAKAVNFGFLYGMQAEKFVLYALKNYGQSFTLGQAVDFRRRFFSRYAGIRAWHSHVFSDSNRARGLTRTILGRIRHLPSTAYNEHANSPVQGSCADGLKQALRLVYFRIKDQLSSYAKMVHMVHDEIILETDDDDEIANKAEEVLKTAMVDGIQPMLKDVPVIAEGGQASSWAEK